MFPDYLTFVRFQDKRNLIYIYLISLIMLGFYWKNAGFTFSARDIGFVSGILALVLYNFTADLQAYWAYKCVIKHIEFSYFINKKNTKIAIILTQPFIATGLALALFYCIGWGIYALIPSFYTLPVIALLMPLIIFILFRSIRTRYVNQVAISVAQRVKYKTLMQYVLISVCVTTVMNLLTISPLNNSEAFSFYGKWLSIGSVLAVGIVCAVVLTMNLLFLRFTRRYIFLGRLFLKEIDLLFSTAAPWPALFARPLWQRLLMLLVIEVFWMTLVALMATVIGMRVWFEVYFFLCYLPCLVYYFLHTWWQWHHDFMMSCDMYFRWGELSKQTSLW